MARTSAGLFTIGYEGREPDELVAILEAARIELLVDVRELPLSRKRGFSKTPLSSAMKAAGIDYVHLRAAGNPFRKAADGLARYRATLDRSVVDQVAGVARERRAALLCFCREASTCHRGVLASRVARALRVARRDL